MTPAQRATHERIAAGPRGEVPRPFLAMLDALSEAVGRLAALVGRSGATEAVAIAGCDPLLALFLAAAGLDSPLPEGRGAGRGSEDP